MAKARIESYAYSEGPRAIQSPATAAGATAKYNATQSIAVIEQATPGTTTYARPASPSLFADVLADWATTLSWAAPAGAPAGVYAVSYNTATRKVTINTTNAVAFRPVMQGRGATWLGITQALAGWQTSWTGASNAGGALEPLGIEVEPVEDASRVQLLRFRYRRALAPVWGNVQLFRARVWIDRTVDLAALTNGWCLTGRIRLWQASGVLTAYAKDNPDGYIDGIVIDSERLEAHGESERVLVVDLTIAAARYT